MSKIISVLKLMRPQSVCLMLLFIYIPLVVGSHKYIYALIQVMPFYFLLTGEIILNDYMDVSKDKINKPHRPLAAGTVSMQMGKMLIYIFLSCAVGLGGIIYYKVVIRCMLFGGVFLILTIYSLYINKLAEWKTFITGITTSICLSFIFTYFEVKNVQVQYAIVAFLYISGRELLMDIRDYEGDKICECKTLAVRYGKEKIYGLAVLLIVLSQFIYVIAIWRWSNQMGKILCGIAIVMLIWALKEFRKSDSARQNSIIIMLWVPILLSIINIL